jgi:hypothetical protein
MNIFISTFLGWAFFLGAIFGWTFFLAFVVWRVRIIHKERLAKKSQRKREEKRKTWLPEPPVLLTPKERREYMLNHIKDEPSEGVTMDITAEYRNIVQLWHPATEKPHCIGQLLCWCYDRTFFVHNHYSHDDENWHLFISTNNIKRYCYISNLEPEWFI